LPDAPWIMTQTWHELLFAHWPVEVAALRERVPSGLPLDLYDGQAWLGIVPFHMTNVGPRGIPLPAFVSSFPELNVRTYVSLGGKAGVYFFSLDAGSSVAVSTARLLFGLPYFSATMHTEERDGVIRYTSRRVGQLSQAEFTATYRPVSPPAPPVPGSLDHFLTERYCLYTADDSGRVRRLDIHHPRWALQRAEANIQVNTMADAAGIRLPSDLPLLHFSKRQDAVAWQSRGVGPPET
jgi:uncharacterized protein YqjF (DUF2071 family)